MKIVERWTGGKYLLSREELLKLLNLNTDNEIIDIDYNGSTVEIFVEKTMGEKK